MNRMVGKSTLHFNKHYEVLVSCSGQKIQIDVFPEPSGNFRELQEPLETFSQIVHGRTYKQTDIH